MAVPCGNPQWPSLAATHNGRPSRLLTMAVPRGYSQWQSLTQMWTVKNNFGLLHLILFGWLIKKLSCLIIIFPFIIFILPSLGLCSQRRSHHLHHLSHASVASLMDRLNKTTKNFTEYSASHAIVFLVEVFIILHQMWRCFRAYLTMTSINIYLYI